MSVAVPLEKLTASQKKAVLHKEGPLLVLAGPGSGKTRVITCRIAALIESGVRPYHICAITFTNKAAEEMRSRGEASGCRGVWISTFHSLCVRLLRQYAEQAGIKPSFTIYDSGDQLRCMKEAVAACQVDSGSFSPSRMLEFVSRLKNNLEDADSFKAATFDHFGKTAAKVYASYQQILARNNALDFDDLLVKTALLLRNNAQVRTELSNRFQYLLIDEYQDTNHAQYQIARLLAQTHGNICVTGDPDQSIYRWRGADIGNILAFEKDWPKSVVVKLEENFRSCGKILACADKLIGSNTRRKVKQLIATRPEGSDVEFLVADDENAEARLLTDRIQKQIAAGVDPGQIAAFYRVNSMSRPIEEAFIRARIPYQVVRGVEFYARKEIQDFLSYLKLIANPVDDLAFMRAIATHSRGIGKTSVDRLTQFAKDSGMSLLAAADYADHLTSVSSSTRTRIREFAKMIQKFQQDSSGEVAPQMDCVFAETGYADALKNEANTDAIENINELINAAAEYDREAENPSLLDYLQSIALYSDTDAYDAGTSRTSLMTMHAAKGLEFDHVYIAGLEEGLLPHERSVHSPDDLEEERRLFFVGITRARDSLTVTYARHRVLRGQFIRSTPSQFLYEVGFGGEKVSFEEDSYGIEEQEPMINPSSSTPKAGMFKVGEVVIHNTFGTGRVKEFLDLGPDSIVVVQFQSGKTKSLMVKYANLTRAGK
ncbi:MAG: UvrD-helicase domain-containing protein [Sedimentisphaerales bacterium]|nr:UvrD-helicase domain-containing protein [Sedimentisphaerales bacterium]